VFKKSSFYLVPHPDDWVLFMMPSVCADIRNQHTKVIFIYLTSGDQGLGTGSRGKRHPFYLAREGGAELANRFLARGLRTTTTMKHNEHPLLRVSYGSTVSYFMRLPDGNMLGQGFPDTGLQSLRKLSLGESQPVRAIDNSTTYATWSDLIDTVRSILSFEREGDAAIELHFFDPDEKLNHNDHSDHKFSAKVGLDSVARLSNVRIVTHLGYVKARQSRNMPVWPSLLQFATLQVMFTGLSRLDHGVVRYRYLKYIGKDYSRLGLSSVPVETTNHNAPKQTRGKTIA
jgi:LmbE family N-acetylglucosaminyl deacetylase